MTEDLVAALHPPRLPEEFAALGWDDLLAAFGIGMLVAALILLLIGPLLVRRPRLPRLAARIAALEALSPHEHLLALARLQAERGGAVPPELRAGLYAREPADPAALAAAIMGRAPRGANASSSTSTSNNNGRAQG